MPEQYDNTNRGAIWQNKRKETETHPDFKGTIDVEGKEYWLSGWKRKEGASPNAPALSLSVQPKEAQAPSAGVPGAPTPTPVPGGGVEDDIPFASAEAGWFI